MPTVSPRRLVSTLTADLRYALRRWRRRPGFAATAIGTLALGIAATTAIFSVVDAVLLQPLPWHEPDRLVSIHGVEPERLQRATQAATWNRATFGAREWQALQQSEAFESVAAWLPARFLYTGDSGPELLDGLYLSANVVQALRIRPALGRMFTPDEDRVSSSHVLISHRMWHRTFGGAEVIGRSIAVGLGPSDRGEPRTIVGVLPPQLRFQGQEPELVLPLGVMAFNLSFETNRPLRLLARLAPDVTVDRARAVTMSVIQPTESSPTRTARVVPLTDEELGQAARPLWLLFGGAGLLLLVACTNVAGLLLGEARARRHEIAVRLSLGGSAGRILRQLTVEQLLLATTAAAAGVLLAVWLTPLLVAMAPAQLPRLDMVAVNLRIAALGIGVGVATALAFALAPAMLLARTPAVVVLAEGGRDGGARRTIGQRLVVAVQIGMALVLVVGAGLFGETIARMTARPLGFTSEGLLVVSLSQAARPYTAAEWQQIVDRRNDPNTPRAVPSRFSRDEIQRRYREYNLSRTTSVLTRLSSLPGVRSVAGVNAAPFVATPAQSRVRDARQPPGHEIPVARLNVTQDYFAAVGLPIVRGRGFADADSLESRRIIVSRELDQRLFNGQAVGQRIAVRSSGAAPDLLYEIIGVVENAKQRGYADDAGAAMYVHDREGVTIANTSVGQYVLRTSGDAAALVPLVREAFRSGDPPIAVTAVRTMDDLAAESVAEPRFRATLATAFGAAALLLAAVGLYGLATRRVEERRREISVRIALGAQRSDVRRLVLTDTLRTLLIGLAIGVPAAFTASQTLRALLFGVSPSAPHTFALASAVLALTAIVATIVPARRAAAADPIAALKE